MVLYFGTFEVAGITTSYVGGNENSYHGIAENKI